MPIRLYEAIEPYRLRAGLDGPRAVRVIHMVSDTVIEPTTAVDAMVASVAPGTGVDAQDCVNGPSLAIGQPWPNSTLATVPNSNLRVRNYNVQAIPGNPLELYVAVEYGEPIETSFGGAINQEFSTATIVKRMVPIQLYRKIQTGVNGAPDVWAKAQIYNWPRIGFRVVIQRTAGPVGSPGGPVLPVLAEQSGRFYSLEGSGLGFPVNTIFWKESVEVRRVSATQTVVRHYFYTENPTLAFFPNGDQNFAQIPALPPFASPIDSIGFSGAPSYTPFLDTQFAPPAASFTP